MKNEFKYFSLLLIASSLLCSCSSNTENYVKIKISSPNNGEVISPEDVIIKETCHSFEDKSFYDFQRFPSVGDVNLLVIPILLPGYEVIDLDNDGISDNEKVLKDINKAFFASDEDETLYYESVSSYYKKSSFGKLNISGTVTDWFDIKEAGYIYSNASEIDVEDTYEIVEDAVLWAKNNQKINLKDYDNDNDGYIDGVWCIYSCPNYTNDGPHTENRNYWAYTSYENTDKSSSRADIDNPVYNLFGWASYDFMYEEGDKIDSHTYIHEMGHFFGLQDYYSDTNSYNPVGKVDMMDANIIDHNSYSKMLLGWTKPYIVTGGNISINLKSMQNENSFIVIPSDNTTIINNEFDPFSEYILIEYYTPDGLNALDSVNKLSTSPIGINDKGVRIYHIDNRKFSVEIDKYYNVKTTLYDGHTLSSNESLILPISNSRNLSIYNLGFGIDQIYNLFDEIRLIEKGNIDTFTSGGKQTINSLFITGDEFSLDKYGKNFFVNEDKMNNGDSFSYEIKIEEMM